MILEAHDGEEGLKISLKEQPDIILLDIVMPKMDGITMLKELREDRWGKNAKVLLLNTLSRNEKIAEAMSLGTFEYLIKTDWKIEEVVKRVKEKLS